MSASNLIFIHYIGPFIPGWPLIKMVSVPLAIYALATSRLVGYLRVRRNWPTPYTRKTFHAIVFTSAGILQTVLGLGAVSLYGLLVVSIIFYAVYREDGSWLYRALGRAKDRPRRTLFILVPLVATGIGGVSSNLFFADWAVAGYLFCGLGDAVAEPVGEYWGTHHYSVPGLAGVDVDRTWEGSAAVFFVGTPAILAGLLAHQVPLTVALYLSLVGGVVGVAVEALSYHGLDNFTLQLAVSGAVYGAAGLL